jgi:hypothetical protein
MGEAAKACPKGQSEGQHRSVEIMSINVQSGKKCDSSLHNVI